MDRRNGSQPSRFPVPIRNRVVGSIPTLSSFICGERIGAMGTTPEMVPKVNG